MHRYTMTFLLESERAQRERGERKQNTKPSARTTETPQRNKCVTETRVLCVVLSIAVFLFLRPRRLAATASPRLAWLFQYTDPHTSWILSHQQPCTLLASASPLRATHTHVLWSVDPLPHSQTTTHRPPVLVVVVPPFKPTHPSCPPPPPRPPPSPHPPHIHPRPSSSPPPASPPPPPQPPQPQP